MYKIKYMELLFKEVFNKYQVNKFESSNSVSKEIITPMYTSIGRWSHDTTLEDELSFVENYGNPCCSLGHDRHTIVVEKNEKKITIKIFTLHRGRRLTKKFFRVETSINFITYRIKDGAVFYGFVNNYHKKRNNRKVLRRFTFGQKDIINEFSRKVRDVYDNYKGLSNRDITKELTTPLDLFINEVTNSEEKGPDVFYKFIMDRQGIKFPNNIMAFVDSEYPTVNKKIRSKFGDKYIESFMGAREYTGKKIKRVLHSLRSYNSNVFESLCGLFGYEYLINFATDDEMKSIFEYPTNSSFPFQYSGYEFTDTEKLNVFKICMLGVKREIPIRSIGDHLRFYRKINLFESCKWVANNTEGFQYEHEVWAEKVSSYDNGDFSRIYNDSFIERVEKVIMGVDKSYIPVILKTSKEYNEESSTQNNCVRTYIKSPNSLIVSLREKNDDKVRGTIEYRVNHDGEKFDLTRVQTLGRFNKRLDDSWNSPIAQLDKVVYDSVEDGLFNDMNIEVELNGSKIRSRVKVIEVSVSKVFPINDNVIVNNYRLEWEDEKVLTIGNNSVGDEWGFDGDFNIDEIFVEV